MLWTDGRLQAAQELDANRKRMRYRGQCRSGAGGWASFQAGSANGIISYLISNKMRTSASGHRSPQAIASRWPDADLIDEVPSRTACHDELNWPAVLFSEAFSPDWRPPALHTCGARPGFPPARWLQASLMTSETPGGASLRRSDPVADPCMGRIWLSPRG
jgi:hypothetical protein